MAGLAGGGGVAHIPWYATVFRGDKLSAALEEIAPVSLRYGGTWYAVHRYDDDRYKFLQMAAFPDADSWYAYWEGPEFNAWRAKYQGWYQVPILYSMTLQVTQGAFTPDPDPVAD